MCLTPMQEILILLEDEKEVPLYRLNRWGRPARGALSKLKNLGYAQKSNLDGEIIYKITPKGEKFFDETLLVLKDNKKWDQKWRLVMFDIPENQRSVRDKLRRALSNLNMGILQASVWISTNDIKDKIAKISERLSLGSSLRYFEVTSTPLVNQQIINKAWNLPEINMALDKFVKEANHALKSMGKGNGDRFKAKKLIFEYATIIKKDPKLPLEFVQKDEVRNDALEIYTKLRKFVF